jgi:hypothetical protein
MATEGRAPRLIVFQLYEYLQSVSRIRWLVESLALGQISATNRDNRYLANTGSKRDQEIGTSRYGLSCEDTKTKGPHESGGRVITLDIGMFF